MWVYSTDRRPVLIPWLASELTCFLIKRMRPSRHAVIGAPETITASLESTSKLNKQEHSNSFSEDEEEEEEEEEDVLSQHEDIGKVDDWVAEVVGPLYGEKSTVEFGLDGWIWSDPKDVGSLFFSVADTTRLTLENSPRVSDQSYSSSSHNTTPTLCSDILSTLVSIQIRPHRHRLEHAPHPSSSRRHLVQLTPIPICPNSRLKHGTFDHRPSLGFSFNAGLKIWLRWRSPEVMGGMQHRLERGLITVAWLRLSQGRRLRSLSIDASMGTASDEVVLYSCNRNWICRSQSTPCHKSSETLLPNIMLALSIESQRQQSFQQSFLSSSDFYSSKNGVNCGRYHYLTDRIRIFQEATDWTKGRAHCCQRLLAARCRL